MAGDAGGRAPIAVAIASLGLLLAGCASNPGFGPSAGAPGDGRGFYRVGKPYEIDGVWYYPEVDYSYDKTGVASWYGREFQGRATANGEIFDMNRLTAANTTLPMPSIVEVTNLQNGRELRLRVNDRGPFRDGRLIDVSRRAAQLLGFEAQGTAPVEVRILKDASIRVAEAAMRGNDQGDMFVAAAEAPPPPVYRPLAPVYRPPAPAPRIALDAASRSAAPPERPRPVNLPPPAPAANEMAATAPRRLSQPERQAPTPPPDRFAELSRFALITPAEAAPFPHAPLPHAPARTIAAMPAPTAKPPFSAASLAQDRIRRPARFSTQLYVQAGAFAMRANARRVVSRVAALGNVRVRTAAVHGVELYRVQVGPVRSREQADRLLRRVVASGYSGARIVTD